MRKTKKKVNEEIGRIIKKHGGQSAVQLFKALSKVGGSNFRRGMRRIHRIIKKQVKSSEQT